MNFKKKSFPRNSVILGHCNSKNQMQIQDKYQKDKMVQANNENYNKKYKQKEQIMNKKEKNSTKISLKTRMCQRALQGLCDLDEACKFAHSYKQIQKNIQKDFILNDTRKILKLQDHSFQKNLLMISEFRSETEIFFQDQMKQLKQIKIMIQQLNEKENDQIKINDLQQLQQQIYNQAALYQRKIQNLLMKQNQNHYEQQNFFQKNIFKLNLEQCVTKEKIIFILNNFRQLYKNCQLRENQFMLIEKFLGYNQINEAYIFLAQFIKGTKFNNTELLLNNLIYNRMKQIDFYSIYKTPQQLKIIQSIQNYFFFKNVTTNFKLQFSKSRIQTKNFKQIND